MRIVNISDQTSGCSRGQQVQTGLRGYHLKASYKKIVATCIIVDLFEPVEHVEPFEHFPCIHLAVIGGFLCCCRCNYNVLKKALSEIMFLLVNHKILSELI